MSLKTPNIYAAGFWVLAEPFKVPANTSFTCMAIRSIKDLVVKEIDPYREFYLKEGISREKYDEDVSLLVNIITLMSDEHETVYVPDTYIIGYPDISSFLYRHMVMSISLGAIPDTIELNHLVTKITDITKDSIGIDSKVIIHQAGSGGQHIDPIMHHIFETARHAAIKYKTTSYSDLVKANLTIEEQAEKIAELENVLTTPNMANYLQYI